MHLLVVVSTLAGVHALQLTTTRFTKHSFQSRPTQVTLFSSPERMEKDKITPLGVDKKANPEQDSADYNKMKEPAQNAGPTKDAFANYVDFGDEFDGGDGQMGVAGDGNKGLEKIGRDTQATVVSTKSRDRSAKNAWGTSTGYAEELVAKGVDTARAQQFENYQNQMNLNNVRKEANKLSEDNVSEDTPDEDWRTMAKFGVERLQDFSLEETFGPVAPDPANLEEDIVLQAIPQGISAKTVLLRNPFMGFADFRAALSDDTPLSITVEPTEGNIGKNFDTEIVVKFSPEVIGEVEGYLVIDTEDIKKTYKLIGKTS